MFVDKNFRLDNKSAGRQSVGSNLIKPDDEVDDADSMAAYGEGDTGILIIFCSILHFCSLPIDSVDIRNIVFFIYFILIYLFILILFFLILYEKVE